MLKPSSSVALHRHSNALVDILPPEADSSIAMLGSDEKPDVTYADVGGLDMQKQEIREAVELPLTHFDLYKQIGIDPPRGVLLYGPPGTGKTMLVKAVANSTTANFIRVVGSEFVQKYLGEGPRMVRDVFRMARENSPAIIFIDEIDAIATKRFDAQTGADREVQRILLELLNQMDGFDQTSNVKVIMATNRADTLDPALLRPGRLDRKIEFPNLKDRRERRLIFTTIASKMSLSPEVDLDSLIIRNDPLSGAIIAAIMQEAGLRAVRKNRYNIMQADLEDAYSSQVKGAQEGLLYPFLTGCTLTNSHQHKNSTSTSRYGSDEVERETKLQHRNKTPTCGWPYGRRRCSSKVKLELPKCTNNTRCNLVFAFAVFPVPTTSISALLQTKGDATKSGAWVLKGQYLHQSASVFTPRGSPLLGSSILRTSCSTLSDYSLRPPCLASRARKPFSRIDC